MNSRSDRAGEIVCKVPKPARPCQADYSNNASRPNEAGHAYERCFRVHMMKRGHRSNQIKAPRFELVLEEVTEDVFDSRASLSARSLYRGPVQIDTYDALGDGA